MTPTRSTRAEAKRRGVMTEYVDATGRRRVTSTASLEAVLQAMAPVAADGPVFLRPGAALPAGAAAVLLEGGGEVPLRGGRLAARVPTGYHRLRARDGSERPLVVSPGTCHLPNGLRTWGWATQLYACRSAKSWGIGDTGDLERLGRWAARQGAGMLLLNPLGAALPLRAQQPSPYYASSRRFRSPLYIDVAAVPGATAVRGFDRLAERGRGLNATRLIDRDAVYALKLRVLEQAWKAFAGSRDFERFRADGGEQLQRYAVFCSLSERFQSGWPAWPEQYRHPNSGAVARYAPRAHRRVDFHAWLQWLLDRQLRRTASRVPLMHDLAVGFDPAGADAWAFQDMLAPGMHVGAPPDEFNLEGQDWGLPPFDPARLSAAGYQPLVETLRAALSHGGGVRIDHILGFFRMWWVPDGRSPAEGAYVRYPARELLDVLAIESRRAGAVVVGEDLGTVEPGVREELAARNVLSYRLIWFEDTAPRLWPRRSMAAVTTHDLPTIAGTWTGSDIEDQRSAGKGANPAAEARLRERLAEATGAPAEAPVEAVIGDAYEALAEAPSQVLTATLEDACASGRRPNMPGTTDSWPNWRIPLPVPLEQLTRAALPRRIAQALGGPAPRRR